MNLHLDPGMASLVASTSIDANVFSLSWRWHLKFLTPEHSFKHLRVKMRFNWYFQSCNPARTKMFGHKYNQHTSSAPSIRNTLIKLIQETWKNSKVNMDHTFPRLYCILENGAFTIKRTGKSFSRSPVDLTLEQTVTADAASKRTDL